MEAEPPRPSPRWRLVGREREMLNATHRDPAPPGSRLAHRYPEAAMTAPVSRRLFSGNCLFWQPEGPWVKGPSVGRTICIATSSLPLATLRHATAGAPAPVLCLARPAAQLPQPCHGLRPPGAAATRPARVFPERLGTLETRGSDAGGRGRGTQKHKWGRGYEI